MTTEPHTAMTEHTPLLPGLSSVENHEIVTRFDGGVLSSNDGTEVLRYGVLRYGGFGKFRRQIMLRLLAGVFLAVVMLAGGNAAQAKRAWEKPILQIDSGGHGSLIRQFISGICEPAKCRRN